MHALCAGGRKDTVGTVHSTNPDVPRTEKGTPKTSAGTLAVIGDLKQMSSRWLRGVSILAEQFGVGYAKDAIQALEFCKKVMEKDGEGSER